MGKWIVWGIVGLVLLVVIGAGASWAWRYFTAPIEGRVGVQEQIQSKETIITAYNHFFDLYAAIQTYEAQLKAMDEELKQVTSEDERERILANIAGIKGQQARAINQYNADARKDYTIGQFRDLTLPGRIELPYQITK